MILPPPSANAATPVDPLVSEVAVPPVIAARSSGSPPA